jgi:alkylation response protein AidB-like acyl-CoA dehydrogenase
MKFAPSLEQRDFVRSVAALLAAADTVGVARSWAAGDTGPGRSLWRKLADQGVLALGLAPEQGGFGATPVDLVLAFEQLGRAAVPGPYVESVAVLPALLSGTRAADRLDAVAAGAVIATVALPPATPRALDGQLADVVYVADAGALATAVIGASRRSVDATRRLVDVTAGELLTEIGDTGAAVNLGTLATAAQILGLGAALLEKSTGYAVQRSQFGKVIGGFQAVKHALADVAIGLELARPLLFGAALALGTPDAARDVSAAKVACTDAAYRAARTALQVHGAIGYTAEYDLGLWLTKVRALTSAWGTQAEHRARVAAALKPAS